MHAFYLRQNSKIRLNLKYLMVLKNILENETFTSKEQMFHFPEYFLKSDLSIWPKGSCMGKGLIVIYCVCVSKQESRASQNTSEEEVGVQNEDGK